MANRESKTSVEFTLEELSILGRVLSVELNETYKSRFAMEHEILKDIYNKITKKSHKIIKNIGDDE
tara:strand:+ start:1536 stop:1733 length:198 start_codon:yes stop_codon:yes gene_type:complete